MDLQRSINDMDKYNNIANTPSDFPMFYEAGIKGLTDIDQIYEKNYGFIITEGKRVFTDYCDVPISQTITLIHLNACINSESRTKSVVMIVAYKEVAQDTFMYYISEIKKYVHNSEVITKNVKGKDVKVRRCMLKDMEPAMTKVQYTSTVKGMCDCLE